MTNLPRPTIRELNHNILFASTRPIAALRARRYVFLIANAAALTADLTRLANGRLILTNARQLTAGFAFIRFNLLGLTITGGVLKVK